MNKKIKQMRIIYRLAAGLLFMLLTGIISAQERQSILEREEELERNRLDSILTHYNKKWEVKLSCGKWIFTNDAKSTDEELFFLPDNMNLWQLSGAWHFHERFSVDMSFGIQKYKDDVGRPNIFSIISGEEIDLEGGGGGFVPIDLNLKYYLSKKRFRPYIQMGGGFVAATSTYIIATGNINDGIEKTEYTFKARSPFWNLASGFDFRSGEWVNLGLDFKYYKSKKFDETIGGYNNYNGVLISAHFAIVF